MTLPVYRVYKSAQGVFFRRRPRYIHGMTARMEPYFVEYAKVKRNDAVTVRLHNGAEFRRTVRSPGRIGAVYGGGPKEWSPRWTAVRGLTPWLLAPKGAYVSLRVNGRTVLDNSLCIHPAWIGAMMDA